MPLTYQTTVPVLLLILVGYIIVCLLIGAKKIYFEPWANKQSTDEPEKEPPSEAN